MSIDASRWAWTQQVTPSQKIVLLSLADRADEDGYCYPSVKRLELDCSMTRRTIQRNLSELEALNLIERKSRFTESGQTSNDFFLIGIVDRHGEIKTQSDRVGRRKPIKSSSSSDTPPAPSVAHPRAISGAPPAPSVTPPRAISGAPPAPSVAHRIINQSSNNHQKNQHEREKTTLEKHEKTRLESIKTIVESKKPELLAEFKRTGFVVTKTWGTILKPDLELVGLFD